jgi:enamine deaminase RidA (YjgF/YER057c/UK114 family)
VPLIQEPAIPDTTAKIERFRPSHLHNKPHFTSLVTCEGGKTIHVSGLVASDANGELVAPGDLGGQMNYIFENIKLALAEVGATPANVVRQRIFVLDMQLDHRPVISGAMNAFYGDGGSAASTCIGASALLIEGALVEIDVTAVIDG